MVATRPSPSTQTQYVVPSELDLHPVAGSSNNSQTIWEGLDLSRGFEVTLPGSQELTPEAMTLVSRMFDVTQCAGGSQSPSPIQALSTPHPPTPEHIIEAHMSQLSSLTSKLMVTPTGSPPHMEMIEEGDRDIIAHFVAISPNPSLHGKNIPNCMIDNVSML